jgi:murein DD-endopeptidase MepM/ murein hydrolase activator NlpD
MYHLVNEGKVSIRGLIRPISPEIPDSLGAGVQYPPEYAKITGFLVHRGQDLLAPSRTPFYLTQGQIVNVYDDLSKFGLYVVNRVNLSTGDTLYLYYCHLSSVLVKIGDLVEDFQVGGYTGASGDATVEGIEHPHLHWEARLNSRDSLAWIDPYRFTLSYPKEIYDLHKPA